MGVETYKEDHFISLFNFKNILFLSCQVILTSLVTEKQQKLRIMMKMHGLGDGPYWAISYAYFLAIYSLYMFFFVLFGSVVGKIYFDTLNFTYLPGSKL